jgi:catechol 2,3-dioxygenase-like lactoylglutathione lyase family enzyme
MRLHHVQVCCPRGEEHHARRFYGDGLGLTEVAKPAELAGRGGAWFRAYDERGEVTAELHVGVEELFRPARKAHPALVLGSEAALEEVLERLVRMGYDVDRSEWETFPGYRRAHTGDFHGNRLELLARPDLRQRSPGP